ncbi:MoxR family ATPase [Haliangium sp. UPWRP_2]|uniref:AAA family ATPase n=1 Tax=Haliangium sp. UPWRP_2 TaxID=1931276 RepID=UPI000B53D25E|nr:MoxR family ATPase [Haliangium sp. UPWRP_2]PSM31870.1 MoxR family ATPase [Haliangium sp. UPWRP_2]
MNALKLQYTGTVCSPDNPYIPSSALIEAVNLAIFLQRPLLLKGEPGCGKTRVASAVAFELKLPFERWPIKSTSRARDGLYTFDAIRRLQEAQLAATNQISPEELRNRSRYLSLGPLGRAYHSEKPTVILIDEIDKADIDFPNDLLNELDEAYFRVEETDQTITARHRPIIFVTSNEEKDLPDAFLRRCLFHYLEFPGEAALVDILNAHFKELDHTLLQRITQRFLGLREKTRDKKASTSELLDWVRVLKQHPQDELLKLLEGRLPYRSVLLKSWRDHLEYLERTAEPTSQPLQPASSPGLAWPPRKGN